MKRMKLIDDLIGSVEDKPVDDLRIGIRYTGVRIGENIGMAFSFPNRRLIHIDEPGVDLIGKKVLSQVKSENLIKASTGNAALNALLPLSEYKKMNVFDPILKMAKNYKNIGIVGRFPFVARLKNKNYKMFEMDPTGDELPASAEEELLPECDLVIITGTALTNHTLERLLEISNGFTMVIGPTTPLSPILFDYGADLLAGVRVNNRKVLEIVSQGGGTREFKPYVEEVVIECKK